MPDDRPDRRQELGQAPVGALLLRYSLPAIVAMMVNSTSNLADTLFQALGRVWPAFLLSITRQILFLIPLLLALPLFLGLEGVWVAHPIADSLPFAVTLLWVRAELRRMGSRV